MYILTVRNTVKRTLGRWFSSSLPRSKKRVDSLQEAEFRGMCFVVDDNDKVIGTASRKECHLVKPDGSLPLHRAFSVFLFNKTGDLLIQKRATTKITYAGYYTSSCCGHPIADIAGEDEEKDALGVKRAAQRRLNNELGISIKSVPLEQFHYITRIRYMDPGNGKWGEHAIDYILIIKQDVTLNPNPNEVSGISFIPKEELNAFLPTLDGPFTLWFELILKNRLKLWWDNLDNLEEFKDHTKIVDLGTCKPPRC